MSERIFFMENTGMFKFSNDYTSITLFKPL